METSRGKHQKELERSFTRRFESNEQLRKRLNGMIDADEREHENDSIARPPSEEAGTGLPTVEDMHATLLAGVRENMEMKLDAPLPGARKRREADDRK